MNENSGSIVAECINIELPKKEKADEVIRNNRIYEEFLLESMEHKEVMNQESRNRMMSGESCWSDDDIYQICNSLNDFEFYWTEMSYYTYDND